jgi:hypothetical protein
VDQAKRIHLIAKQTCTACMTFDLKKEKRKCTLTENRKRPGKVTLDLNNNQYTG